MQCTLVKLGTKNEVLKFSRSVKTPLHLLVRIKQLLAFGNRSTSYQNNFSLNANPDDVWCTRVVDQGTHREATVANGLLVVSEDGCVVFQCRWFQVGSENSVEVQVVDFAEALDQVR